MQLQPNLLFDEHYTLIRLLGVGGFSEVWLAHDSYMDLDVALKIYAPGQGIDEHSITDLRQEIRVVFKLNHTNLLKPSYLGVWNRMPYLVLPYCQQGSITSKIGALSEKEVWKIIHDVASGLQYLHKNDIVHQDIKPDNILLDDADNYVITDFGISTKTRTTLRKSVGNVSTSAGTMAYMGPERFSKQPAPTKASDIWSFGAMVFELITGNVPFGEMGGGLQKSGADIPEITANVSDTLKQTITQMLALDTWDRPTADELVEIANSISVGDKPFKPIESNPQYKQPSAGKETQRIVEPVSVEKEKETQEPTIPKPNNTHKWIWPVICTFLVVGIGIIWLNKSKGSSKHSSNPIVNNSPISYSSTNDINKSRIEGLIKDICRCSSKGGNHSNLANCFTYRVSPYASSGRERYCSDIPNANRDYVERFNEYTISDPINFHYVNNSFPLTVECDINVTWQKNNGKRTKLYVHKIFYITKDYKVSGYIDQDGKKVFL